MNRKQVGIGAAIFLFVAAVITWRFFDTRVDPQIQQLHETQKQLVELSDDATREERRELFGKMRDQVEQLKPEQREEFGRTAMQPMMKAFQKRISSYFELPKEERVAFLDKEIKRMNEFFRDMRPPGGGAAGGGAAKSGDGGPGREGPPGGMNSGNRESFQKRFLDNTSPIQRAQMSEYFKDLMARRRELGMPTFPAPPF